MTVPTINLVIGNDPRNVTLAGLVVRAFCETADLSSLEAALLELAVVEAVNNIIEHACRDLPEAEIRLAAAVAHGALTIELRDPGLALPTPPGDQMPDPLAESGRGWPLILASVDQVDYRNEEGMNVLTLQKRTAA